MSHNDDQTKVWHPEQNSITAEQAANPENPEQLWNPEAAINPAQLRERMQARTVLMEMEQSNSATLKKVMGLGAAAAVTLAAGVWWALPCAADADGARGDPLVAAVASDSVGAAGIGAPAQAEKVNDRAMAEMDAKPMDLKPMDAKAVATLETAAIEMPEEKESEEVRKSTEQKAEGTPAPTQETKVAADAQPQTAAAPKNGPDRVKGPDRGQARDQSPKATKPRPRRAKQARATPKQKARPQKDARPAQTVTASALSSIKNLGTAKSCMNSRFVAKNASARAVVLEHCPSYIKKDGYAAFDKNQSLVLVVSPEGDVVSASYRGQSASTPVADCALQSVRAWKFPSTKGGEDRIVKKSLRFKACTAGANCGA